MPEQQQKAYIGCTIGPIYGVMSRARKPQELWLASYMFSRVMQRMTRLIRGDENRFLYEPCDLPGDMRTTLLDDATDLGVDTSALDNTGCRIYSPDDEDGALTKDVRKAGLYSDRIYFSCEGGKRRGEAIAKAAFDVALVELASVIDDCLNNTGNTRPETRKACLAYLQSCLYVIMCGEMEAPLPMHTLNKRLDLMEQYAPYRESEDGGAVGKSDFFLKLFDKRESMAQSANAPIRRCRWITQSGLGVLDIEEIGLGRHVSEYGDYAGMRDACQTMQYGKYVALVQADGDGMGSLLGSIAAGNVYRASEGAGGELPVKLCDEEREELIRGVSRALFRVQKECIEEVLAFGGHPIYFGGDDMLFLAPASERLFAFIGLLGDKTNQVFNTGWQDDAGRENASVLRGMRFLKKAKGNETIDENNPQSYEERAVSTSFGVTIAYVKYPLQFMRSNAYEALFYEAKHAQWARGRQKNAVSVRFRKHSGQASGLLLSRHPLRDGEDTASMYDQFITLVTQQVSEHTLHALHWKIMEQFDVIWALLQLKKNREDRLTAWFDFNFNEWLEDEKQAQARFADDTVNQPRHQKRDEIVRFLCDMCDECRPPRDDDEDDGAKRKRLQAWKARVRQNVDGAFRIDEFLHTTGKEDDDR